MDYNFLNPLGTLLLVLLEFLISKKLRSTILKVVLLDDCLGAIQLLNFKYYPKDIGTVLSLICNKVGFK